MTNPCFITRNNTTQKFILFFSLPSDKRLTGINSLLLVFVGQLLWNPSGRYFGKFQMLVYDCLNRTNTQAQFVSYFTNRDTSISENAGLNLADPLLPFAALQHKHRHWHIHNCCESEFIIQTLLNVIKYHLNTADNLWWISALVALSATGNFMTILWHYWIIVYIWTIMTSSRDVINKTMVGGVH